MCAMKVDVAWSPTELNRFITVGTDIQLYEVEEYKDGNAKPPGILISETSCASLISTSSDHQYLKCFSWYPKSEHPLLLAVGLASGRVVLESMDPISSRDVDLVGREFAPKQSRSCNCVAWNPIEANILISGLEKYRGDNSIYIWDLTRSTFNPSAIDGVASYERRPMFPLDTPSVSKPILELGSSESTQSIHWFRNNPKLFACGMSMKNLRLYDTRDGTKPQESTTTKAVYNLCVDPDVEHRLASSVDNLFVLWDVRNFEKPVVTINEPRPILKLSWSPTRSGLLAVLCKESSTINLYDIQSPAGDEVEPAVVERNLQPFPSHSIMSFTWHPTHENRMLTISQNNQLLDYTIFDRITLNWSPTSEIVWTYGRKVLQCLDSRDEFYACLNDISVKMRKRACQGYGLKMSKLWMNAELADDAGLHGVWMWLDLMVKGVAETDARKRSHRQPQAKYEGVHSVICGENGTCTLSQSEPNRVQWIGINTTECKIIKYISDERDRALQLCGWSGDDTNTFAKFLDRLEMDGQFTRAATIAVFHLEIRNAIRILSKGALSRGYTGNVDLNTVAMGLAGYTQERTALWREVSSSHKSLLTDPYLRAMFAFLTVEEDNYDEILKDDQIAVQDRLAFACLYLNDRKIAEFLESLRKQMTETGNLDGVLLTGLTNDGLSLIQRYVDTTGDVQTASLIILHTLPSQVWKDPRAQGWVYSYRNLLDTWRLWKERATFDVSWFNKNSTATKPTQQVFVSCNFCRKSVSNYFQFRPTASGQRFAQAPVISSNRKTHDKSKEDNQFQINCCPGCRKPLPRCSLCLCHMGTPSGLHWQRQVDTGPERKKLTDFNNWITWCQTCRHGGHSGHILDWFKHHNECPVTGCMCKCMVLDTTGRLESDTSS